MKFSLSSLKKLSLLGAFILIFSCTKEEAPSMEEGVLDSGQGQEEAQLPSDTAQYSEEGVEGFAIQRVHFDFDQSEILPEHYGSLEDLASYLGTNQGVIVEIEGHCDERGTNEYNLALGQRRAEAVKRYLVNLGADAGQITTITYGEEKPLDTANTPYAHRMNRRAEFNLR